MGTLRMLARETRALSIYSTGGLVIAAGAAALLNPSGAEYFDSPHAMLLGIYSYSSIKAAHGCAWIAARAAKWADTKRYSPEIVALEDKLLDAANQGKVEEFRPIVREMNTAFSEISKNGEKRIAKALSLAHIAALKKTRKDLDTAIGLLYRPEAVDRVWNAYQAAALACRQEYHHTLGKPAPLQLEEKHTLGCVESYLHAKAKDIDAQLYGYDSVHQQSKADKHPPEGHMRDAARQKMIEENIMNAKALARQFSAESVLDELRGLEHNYLIKKVISTELAEAYDMAAHKHPTEVKEYLERIALPNYPADVVRKAKKQIRDLAWENHFRAS